MALSDTIERLANVFKLRSKAILSPEEKQHLEDERIAEEKRRYREFETNVILPAINKLNEIEGVRVGRVYTQTGLLYGVMFSFLPEHMQQIKTVFTIQSQAKSPKVMNIAYTHNMGTPKEVRHSGTIGVDSSVEDIIDFFEQGVQICGPK